MAVCEGDTITLYSIENDDIIEFQVGDRSFPGLEDLCIGKSLRDQISYCGETFVIQYIVQNNSTPKTRKKTTNITSPPVSPKRKESNTIDIHDFIVRTNVYKCTHYNHTLIPVNALVNIMDRGFIREVPFPGMYCEKCNRYYLFERTYQEMKKMGYICCKVVKITELAEYESQNTVFDSWQNKSILNLYGYSVDKNKDLTIEQRHDILAFIIENDILSPHKIVNYLQSFISLRKYNRSMSAAIEKWQQDISYVLRYRKSNKDIRVRSITIRSKQ